MYKIPKQSYTEEFREEAIRQVLSEGKKASHVARELGISGQTLSNWLQAHKLGKDNSKKASVTPE